MEQLTAILITIEAPFPLGIFRLSESKYVLGRGKDNTIILPSLDISRHHATLVKKKHPETNEDCYWIYDGTLAGKKSTNGVFVDRIAIDSCLLKNNNLISLGNNIQLIYHDFVNGTNYLAKEIFTNNKIPTVTVPESLANKETIAIQ